MTRGAVWIAFLVALVTGCGANSAEELIETLPHQVNGATITYETLTDGSVSSGSAVDDVLAAVGRRRSDGAVVVGTWDQGALAAISMPGVSPQALALAATNHWDAPAVVDRSSEVIGGMEVGVLTSRDGATTYVWLFGPTVYVAQTGQRDAVAALIAATARPG